MDNSKRRTPRKPIDLTARGVAEAGKVVEATSPRPNRRAFLPTPDASSRVGQFPRKLISTDELLRRADISRSYLYELRKAKRCPAPIKLSPGRRGGVRYVDFEVDAWIESLMASRTEGTDEE